MSEDYLDSEEDFDFVDGADIVRENENILNTAGETVPYTLDAAALNAFENFDVDDFETKFYPVKKKIKEKRKNSFLSGDSKFFVTKEVDVEEIDLENQIRSAQNDWQKSTPRGKELIDMQTTDVVKIDKRLKKQFVQNLSNNIETIKDFLVNQTAPTELAVANAFEQSRQTLENILGVRLDSTSKQLKSMISDAVILKTFDFIAKNLNLDDKHKQIIINKYYVLSITKTTKRVK